MLDQPSARVSLAKAAALACSVGLGLLVVVNAQFGCDSPTASPPENKQAAPTPDSKPDPEPKAAAEDEAGPAVPAAVNAAPAPAEADEPAAKPAANVDAAPKHEKPVLMPASKSGGDFGAMRFPGEQAPTQQQQQQQQNPAPQAQK